MRGPRAAEDAVLQVEVVAGLPRVSVGLYAQEVAEAPHENNGEIGDTDRGVDVVERRDSLDEEC